MFGLPRKYSVSAAGYVPLIILPCFTDILAVNCGSLVQNDCYNNPSDCYWQLGNISFPGTCRNNTCYNITTQAACVAHNCSFIGNNTNSPPDFVCYTTGSSKDRFALISVNFI